MDPDAALSELRELMSAPLENAERIAELFSALDEWLTRGGFPPVSWAH
jgi:hypothetical protein